MWRFSSSLDWTPGTEGKGNVYRDGDISTWNVDGGGHPHHQERAAEDDEQRPVFLFYITPDGGVYDGGIGFSNTSGNDDAAMVRTILNACEGLYDATEANVDLPMMDPRYEDEYGGYGHAQSILDRFTHWVASTEELDDVEQPHWDPVAELRSWLDGFDAPASQVVSPHHDTVQDMIPKTEPTQAQGDHVDPPANPYDPFDWSRVAKLVESGHTIHHDKNSWGRGVVHNGEVHTWPEDWGTHGQYIYNVLGASPRDCDKFTLNPWGQVSQGPSSPENKQLVQQVLQGQTPTRQFTNDSYNVFTHMKDGHASGLDAHLASLFEEQSEADEAE